MQHRQSDFDTEKTRYEGKLTTANVNNDKLDARLKLEIQTRKDKEFIYKDNQQKNDIALLSLKKTIKGLQDQLNMKVSELGDQAEGNSYMNMISISLLLVGVYYLM